ncbi:MAG: hypothetical protein JWM86_2397 [Thermoleophilia bacterium]|nr:hypothetical protein [Thermoleophilia bacterium]
MSPAATSITIPAWANGPDGSGNGGWTAGLLAGQLAQAPRGVAVSLRVPPPLDRALRIEPAGDGGITLWDDATEEPVLVASADPEDVELQVPDVVRGISLARAQVATTNFPFRDQHPFPRCVSCGTARDPELPALHLHAGLVPACVILDDAGELTPVFAAPWTPSIDMADGDDLTTASVAARWSALDCPSAAPVADPEAENPVVLARIAVRLDAEVSIGHPHIVAAWRLAVDGRKRWTASVLMDADGDVLGIARALWIEVRSR